MVEALNHYDEDGLIFEVVKNNKTIRSYLRKPFEYGHLTVKKFDPELQLDHALPERLELLPIEEEIFYILHFACYAANPSPCYYYVIEKWDEAIFDLSLGKTNRRQTALEIREYLCEKVLQCSLAKDIPSWRDCHRNDTNSMHQKWCKDCKNLYECIPGSTGKSFLKFIFNTFYTWRKYHDKRNIIDASISTYLYNDDSYLAETINNEIPKYIKTNNLFPERNMTMLDEWAYTNLEVIQGINGLVGDTIPIKH